MASSSSPLALAPDELFRRRGRAVVALLRPLSASGRVNVDLADGPWHGGKALGAFDATKPKGDPRDWLFRTFIPDIRCNYFELWKPTDDAEAFAIDRAYLSVFRVIPPATKDYLICLHCDPHDTSPKPMESWKRGPHIHVEAAADPLPRCHFPLNYGHLDEVLSSMEGLMRALADAIDLIARDVLPRYR